MAQKSKESKNLNCKVDIKVSDELEKFIEETKLSKTATVEKALMMYIEHYKKTATFLEVRIVVVFLFVCQTLNLLALGLINDSDDVDTIFDNSVALYAGQR